jgi:hypothetical protein
MASNIVFTGAGNVRAAAGMSRTLRPAVAAAPAAHAGAAAAAIAPPRKRRTAAATGASVDWGSI